LDTNKIIRDSGITPDLVGNFPALCRRASELGRGNMAPEDIVSTVRREFNVRSMLKMRDKKVPYAMFGDPGLDFAYDVMSQMDNAAKLPVFEAGAVLPDGQVGYALPVGGVAALKNAVSPSMVGVDIACRMCMTIMDIPGRDMHGKMRDKAFKNLKKNTRFGFETFDKRKDHDVMDRPEWDDKDLPLHSLKDLAHSQLGTSGGGNHFADVMVGEIIKEVDWIPLKKGDQFSCLVTHSGSRGVGYKMAKKYCSAAEYYTRRIARGVPSSYCWLDMDTDIGREYWKVMNLMGLYAQANHHLIHANFIRDMRCDVMPVDRGTPISAAGKKFDVLENHHNFAWEENDLVVHRKGATPAHKGVPGIIPGSSGTNSYLVEGLGEESSVYSCSHGAGRHESRTASKSKFDYNRFSRHMKDNQILHDGIEGDEAFTAYKDIERVIALQDGILVDVVAKMKPVAVVMGGHSDDGD
jgi:tRNA-splicing ligase RtcB (3'-phosphate/5'-hydroxy nucleic acid ligase)